MKYTLLFISLLLITSCFKGEEEIIANETTETILKKDSPKPDTIISPSPQTIETSGIPKKRKKKKISNITKNNTISIRYTYIKESIEELTVSCTKDKYGFIDKTGRIAVPLIYDKVEPFHEGIAAVKLNGKWGFINENNKEITPTKYDAVDYFHYQKGLAAARENDLWSIIDESGNEVLYIKDATLTSPPFGYIYIGKTGKIGYINRIGKELSPVKNFESSSIFRKRLVKIEKKGLWGYINTTKEIVIPLRYNDASYTPICK